MTWLTSTGWGEEEPGWLPRKSFTRKKTFQSDRYCQCNFCAPTAHFGRGPLFLKEGQTRRQAAGCRRGGQCPQLRVPPHRTGVPDIPVLPEGPVAPRVASPLAKVPHGKGVPRLFSRPSAGGLLARPPGCRSQGRPMAWGPRERCLLRRGVLFLWQRRRWSQGSANKVSIRGVRAQPLAGGEPGTGFPAGRSSPVRWLSDAGSRLPDLCLPCWRHVRGCKTPCKAHALRGCFGIAGSSMPEVPGLPPAQRLRVSLAMPGTPAATPSRGAGAITGDLRPESPALI